MPKRRKEYYDDPRPNGYVARDAIYEIIKQWQESGGDFKELGNRYIFEKIKDKFDVNEKITTISSYKSQYKKANFIKKSQKNIPQLMRAGLKIQELITSLIRDGLSVDDLKFAFNSVIEAIQEES